MSYRDIIQRTWNENHLFSVLLELTYRCNLDCAYCYNDIDAPGVPLSTEDYLRLLEDLADLQVMNLALSGGEPLAHPDFFLLGSRARALGFAVRVKSNGHALRRNLAQRLKQEVDPFIVEVSIHGATAAIHDRQTRTDGSFTRLMANLQECLALGLRLKLHCTLTAWNEHELDAMYALADGLSVPLQVDSRVTPRDNGDRSPLAMTASPQGLALHFRLQEERLTAKAGRGGRQHSKADGTGRPATPRADPNTRTPDQAIAGSSKQCGAGSSTVAVDPYGNVYPCVQWRRPLGNLHRQTVKEIWNGGSRLDDIRALTIEAKRLVDGFGSNGGELDFCPGLAELNTGDPLLVYPEMRRYALLNSKGLHSEPQPPRP